MTKRFAERARSFFPEFLLPPNLSVCGFFLPAPKILCRYPFYRLVFAPMNWKFVLLSLMAALPMAVAISTQAASETDALRDFEQRAAKFKAVISLPHFVTTSNEVRATVKQTIGAGNAGLDRLASQDAHKLTFNNTVRALDDVGYEISLVAN